MTDLRILVTGTRHAGPQAGAQLIAAVLFQSVEVARVAGRDPVIVHGAARGVDRLAHSWAERFGVRIEQHPADWDAHGRSAGMRRNAEMVKLGAEVCLAFPLIGADSNGTWDCIRRAGRAGIPVRIYPIQGPS